MIGLNYERRWQTVDVNGQSLLSPNWTGYRAMSRFIAALMDGKTEFIACDNPYATRLTLHILAAVAEHEREMISARTRAALQAAKARGVRLGRNGAERLAPANRAAAIGRAKALNPLLIDLRAKGMSARQIAAELTNRAIATPRGGCWHPTTVGRLLGRLP